MRIFLTFCLLFCSNSQTWAKLDLGTIHLEGDFFKKEAPEPKEFVERPHFGDRQEYFDSTPSSPPPAPPTKTVPQTSTQDQSTQPTSSNQPLPKDFIIAVQYYVWGLKYGSGIDSVPFPEYVIPLSVFKATDSLTAEDVSDFIVPLKQGEKLDEGLERALKTGGKGTFVRLRHEEALMILNPPIVAEINRTTPYVGILAHLDEKATWSRDDRKALETVEQAVALEIEVSGEVKRPIWEGVKKKVELVKVKEREVYEKSEEYAQTKEDIEKNGPLIQSVFRTRMDQTRRELQAIRSGRFRPGRSYVQNLKLGQVYAGISKFSIEMTNDVAYNVLKNDTLKDPNLSKEVAQDLSNEVKRMSEELQDSSEVSYKIDSKVKVGKEARNVSKDYGYNTEGYLLGLAFAFNRDQFTKAVQDYLSRTRTKDFGDLSDDELYRESERFLKKIFPKGRREIENIVKREQDEYSTCSSAACRELKEIKTKGNSSASKAYPVGDRIFNHPRFHPNKIYESYETPSTLRPQIARKIEIGETVSRNQTDLGINDLKKKSFYEKFVQKYGTDKNGLLSGSAYKAGKEELGVSESDFDQDQDFRRAVSQHAHFKAYNPKSKKDQFLKDLGLATTYSSADNLRNGGSRADTQELNQTSTALLDIALGFNPVSGFIQGLYETFMGETLFGEKLEPWQRSLSFASLLSLGTLSAPLKTISKFGGKMAKGLKRFGRSTSNEEIVGIIKNGSDFFDQAGPQGIKAYSQAKKELSRSGSRLSKDVDQFISNQILHGEQILGKGAHFSKDDLVRIGQKYDDLAKRMDDIVPALVDADVWRATPSKYYDGNGATDELGEMIFRPHPGVKNANGRYSAPGDSAIYTSMGKKEDAWHTVMEELGDYANQDLVLGSKHYKLDKVLDLTDPSTRKTLGITEDMIINSHSNRAYELTHQIGSIAKKKGFDAIKAPSAPQKGGTNLIILGE